jgi:hypothetical protein
MLKTTIVFISIVYAILLQQSCFCQIAENLNDSIYTGEKNYRADKDSLSKDKVKECFPKCREGYFCSNGECISKCNPPCPENMTCGDDGECHGPVKSESIKVRRQLIEMQNISRVASAEEVMQGIIFKTNCLKSEVIIGDTNYTFDNELYLNMPLNHYRVLIKAQGKNTKYQSTVVNIGSIEVFNPHLRSIRLVAAGSLGPAFVNSKLGVMANFDVGFDIASRHFLGFTGSSGSAFSDYTYFNRLDSVYPDTIKMRDSYVGGFGITYGYTGVHFWRYVTLIPKISVGYWLLENQTGYEIDTDKHDYYTYYPINEISYERYFLKPGIELRFGYRVFGFRMHIDNFIGEKIGPFTIGFGALFRIL